MFSSDESSRSRSESGTRNDERSTSRRQSQQQQQRQENATSIPSEVEHHAKKLLDEIDDTSEEVIRAGNNPEDRAQVERLRESVRQVRESARQSRRQRSRSRSNSPRRSRSRSRSRSAQRNNTDKIAKDADEFMLADKDPLEAYPLTKDDDVDEAALITPEKPAPTPEKPAPTPETLTEPATPFSFQTQAENTTTSVTTSVGDFFRKLGTHLQNGIDAANDIDSSATVHTARQVEGVAFTGALPYRIVFFVLKSFVLACVAAYTFSINTTRCHCAADLRKPLVQWGSVIALVMAVVALVYPKVYTDAPVLKLVMMVVSLLVAYGIITYFPSLQHGRCECARPNDWRRWVVEGAVYIVLILFVLAVVGVGVV